MLLLLLRGGMVTIRHPGHIGEPRIQCQSPWESKAVSC